MTRRQHIIMGTTGGIFLKLKEFDPTHPKMLSDPRFDVAKRLSKGQWLPASTFPDPAQTCRPHP